VVYHARVIVPGPAALVIAHPGHELRLFRWLELDHPVVFVLTDGSGRSGRSRIDSTLEVLRTTGCSAGSIMGRFTDREIYRAIIDGDVDPLVKVTTELADALATQGIRSVIADAFELYNPAHDLCSVITNLALSLCGTPIQRYEFAVTAAPGSGVTIELDDAAFERKMETARRCQDLTIDVDELIARYGLDHLHREVLTPIDPEAPMPRPAWKPHYEVCGEERVAAGRYEKVLRYDEHFAPFVAGVRSNLEPSVHEK